MKKSFIKLVGFLLLCITNIVLHAQEKPNYEYLEAKQDNYMPMLKHELRTNHAYFFSTPKIITRQVNLDANGNNIINDAANEPSIAIDPKNPARMAIGWRQFDNILSNFRQAGIGVSENNGMTWKNLLPLDAGIFRSDPVLCADNRGNFYYNALGGNFVCDVYKTSQLENWQNRVYGHGGDKQWMTVDNTGQRSDGNLYTYWNSDYSSCDDYNFTRSTDKGQNFESCSLIPSYLTRGTLTVATDGTLFAAGSRFGTHYVNRSSSAKISTSVPEWDLTSFVNMPGELASYNGPNPNGLLGQVWIASDHSTTASRGNLYVLSTIFRNDVGDLIDIMFSKSEDQGETWSEPIAINKDGNNSNWQWFGTMSVAPNGRIDVIWLDTRDHPGTLLSALYYSFSTDAGKNWSADQKLSESFDPHVGYPNQSKIGDYFHMISDNKGAHLAWTATFNGGQDVYYSYITPEITTPTTIITNTNAALSVYPNPITYNTQIQFDSPIDQNINLFIYDNLANKIYQSKSFQVAAGNNILKTSQIMDDLLPGIYNLQVYTEKGQRHSIKLIVLN